MIPQVSREITPVIRRDSLPTSGADHVPARRRLRLVIDLRLIEFANALGLTMSLTMLRRGTALAVLVGTLVVPAAAAAGAVLAGNSLDTVKLERYVLGPVLLLMVYTGVASLLAETLGRFRHSVSGHPNRSFFRALDIPATTIYLVYALPRTAGPGLLWLLVGAGVGAGFSLSDAYDGSSNAPAMIWTALLCVPVALGLATSAAGLYAASHRGSTQPRLWKAAALTIPAGLTLGAAVTWLILPLLQSTAASQGSGPLSLPALTFPALILLATCASAMIPLWGRLRRISFPAEAHPAQSHKFPRFGPAGMRWARILSDQRLSGWRYLVQVRITAALLGGIAALGAALLSGAPTLSTTSLLEPGLFEDLVLPTIAFSAVLFGVTLADLTINDIGPHAYGRHLRTAVESGAEVRTAVTAQLLAVVAPVAALSALLAGGTSLLLGFAVFSPFVLGVGAVAAALIAETLFPPPRAADGTAAESIFTGLATLVLAALPAAIPLSFPAADPWFMPLGVAALLGGATVCLRKHITSLS